MKSLNELWEENGCKPIKVVRENWFHDSYFFVKEKTPFGDFIGYNGSGRGIVYEVYCLEDDKRFKLYEEKTEEKIFYKAIGCTGELYRESDHLFEDEESAKRLLGKEFVCLLTEYPIKIKVKK